MKLTLVDVPRFINLHSPPMPLLAVNLAEVYLPLALHHLQPRRVEQPRKGKVLLREELVLHEKVAKLVLRKPPERLSYPALLDGLHSQDLDLELLVLSDEGLGLGLPEGDLEGVVLFLLLGARHQLIKLHPPP